jgi:hypothetical protein
MQTTVRTAWDASLDRRPPSNPRPRKAGQSFSRLRDLLVLSRVDTLGRVGSEHELPPITHPQGVDLSDARVFPLEVSSPGKEVAMGAGGSAHGLIHPMRSISPRGWDGNVEGWDERGGFGWETTTQVARNKGECRRSQSWEDRARGSGTKPRVR